MQSTYRCTSIVERYRCAQSLTNWGTKLNKSPGGGADGWNGKGGGGKLEATLCPLSPVYLWTFLGSVPTAGESSVYDSNPDESLKRDFQDWATVTRRNGPVRKNLPSNDPKLFAAYKLQNSRADSDSSFYPQWINILACPVKLKINNYEYLCTQMVNKIIFYYF